MACYHPLRGYRSRSVGASGKRAIVFTVADGFVDLPVVLPCGQCDGCKLERSRQWAVRCVHEASLYDRNCFITLTYSDQFLPAHGSLERGVFAKFMKRLRKKFPRGKGDGIRYFHCGEYGDASGRPHYHCCLFNFDFPDKYRWAIRNGYQVWRSEVLEALWPFGQSEIGSVTYESAAYVARYVMKKVSGPYAQAWYLELDEETGEVAELLPEYTTMSRKPGIGKPWLDKFMSEVYPADSVVMGGRLVKPPRYYDSKYELVDGAGALELARERRRSRRLEDETPERLLVREQCTRARLARSERSL